MGLFGKLIQLGVQIATTPVAIIKDVATMGGALNDRRESYTETKLRDIQEKAEEAYDELD